MMRKLLSLFLVLIATSALLAADSFVRDGIAYYILGGDSVEVVSKSPKYSGDITIPATVYTYRVTSIGGSAFSGCSSLSSVSLPNSITNIGDMAFRDCSALTSINIPNSVTSIGAAAFYGCSSLPVENNVRYAGAYLVEAVDNTLSTYTIKPGTKWIGTSAFVSCPSLTSITIPNSVTSIGGSAFSGCSFTSIIIPNSVTSIGHYAFSSCKSLTSIDIPNSITSIENNTFSNCDSLTSITLPNCVTRIGDYAFQYCKSLTSITLPNSVTSIGGCAFQYCISLISITIPQGVTDIGQNAFYYCFALQSVTIPNTVTDIKYGTFNSCSSLSSINIPNSIKTIGDWAFYSCNSLASITIPNSVTYIGYNTFGSCSSLSSITIGDSVKTIGESAFKFCSSLTTLTIPNSVTSIGASAFAGCNSLSTVFIGNNVKRIESGTFEDCFSLHTINIPDSVTSIGNYAFDDCVSFTALTIPDTVTSIGTGAFNKVNNIVYSGSATYASNDQYWGAKCMNGYVEGYFVYKDATKTTLCGCSAAATGNISVLNSVTNIGSSAFSGCSSLSSVSLPNSVTSIGSSAFSGCRSLTSIIIPNSVTEIGNHAFYYCTSLASITCYATTPPTCGENCFYYVSTYIPLYVPAGSVQAYKEADCWNAFYIHAISELPNVITYVASQKLPEATVANPCGLHTGAFNVAISDHSFSDGHGVITFTGNVTSIGDSAFYYAVLDSITIPQTVTNIGARAFESCFVLDSITIPNGVVSIGEMAFSSCTSLNSVTIPESVTSIGRCAFNGCPKFTSIDVDAGNTHYVSIDGVLFNYAKDTLIQYPAGNTRASYTIPHSVANIEEFAFFNCSKLDFVFLPSSVSSIGDGAFYGCSELDSITCEAVEPPTCDVWSFKDVVKTIPLYVPAGSVQAYKEADWWKEFMNIKAAPDVPSDLHQLTASPINRSTKIIKGGQLLILHDGKPYNAQGGIVE